MGFIRKATIAFMIIFHGMFCGSVATNSFSDEIWEMGSESAIYTSPDDKFMTDIAVDGTNFLVVGHQILVNGDDPFPFALLISTTGNLIKQISFDTLHPGSFPRVSFDGTNYLVVWSAHVSEEKSNIFAQFISTTGIPLGSPFSVSEASGFQETGDIASDGNSHLVIWTDRRNENADIYGQFISPTGDLIGSEIPVCTAPYNQKDPAVSTNGESYLVVWNDGQRMKRGYGEDIYGQIITVTGKLDGSSFVISQNDHPSDNPMSVATDGTLYCVAWMEEVGGHESGEWDIFGQLVTSSGTLVGNEIRLTEKTGGQYYPSLAFDGTYYLAVWTDMANDLNKNGYHDLGEGTGSDISGIFLDVSGIPVGEEFVISAAPKDQIGAGVCFGAERHFVGWTDTRAETHGVHQGIPHGDIYSVSFHKTTPTGLKSEPNPVPFSLYQNFPNPFNPATTITFSIPVRSEVRLAVYDLLGREVAVLAEGDYKSGVHSIVWKASDQLGDRVGSGVYLVRLSAGPFTSNIKVLLMK